MFNSLNTKICSISEAF